MPQILKSHLAEEDLINIWRYTYRNRGVEQADFYLNDLDQSLHLLAKSPELARLREELNPPVRIHRHNHHLLVYKIIDSGIRLIRVLHESMDIENQLYQDE